MTTRITPALTVAALALSVVTMSAHHSFSAEFDANKPVTLKGTLTRMDWVNPHGWIYVDVKNPDGTATTWMVETGAPNALYRRGFRKPDFPSGIEVVVTGFAAKNGTHTANGQTVKLPDGRSFFAGSSGSPGAAAAGADQ
jgi:hypothetical protein